MHKGDTVIRANNDLVGHCVTEIPEHKKRGNLGNAGLKTVAELCGLRHVLDLGQIFVDDSILIETLK